MSVCDWTTLLTGPADATRHLGPTPDLSDYGLAYVHVDERDTSVTLGFELDALPPRPLAEWTEKGLNAFEFALTFTGVTNLRMRGWGTTRDKTVSLTASGGAGGGAGGGGAGTDVVITGPGEQVSFTAESARFASARAYLASRGA